MQYNFYKLFWLLFPIFCILFIYEDIYTNYENTNEINLESHDVMVFSQSSILGLTSNCTYIPDTLSPCMNANDCAMHMCTIYNNPATDKLMLVTDPRTQISPACNNISPKQGIIHDHTFGA